MVTVPVVITILITFFAPFVYAIIQKTHWSSQSKSLLALAGSAVIAIVYMILTGDITPAILTDFSKLSLVIPAVYGLQTAIYQFILKAPVKRLENITTPGVDVNGNPVAPEAEVIDYSEPLPDAPTVSEVEQTRPAQTPNDSSPVALG